MLQLFAPVMQPLEYLLSFLITEIGIEATFQVVYEAVNQDTSSLQSHQLYSAFRAVIAQKQRQ